MIRLPSVEISVACGKDLSMTSGNPDHSPAPSTQDTINQGEAEPIDTPLDRFSIVVYGLVALAMLGQAGWILWLEYLI